jgi:hypothetical protein
MVNSEFRRSQLPTTRCCSTRTVFARGQAIATAIGRAGVRPDLRTWSRRFCGADQPASCAAVTRCRARQRLHGDKFRYRSTGIRGAWHSAATATAAFGMGFFSSRCCGCPVWSALAAMGPAPGEGPSDDTMTGYYECR